MDTLSCTTRSKLTSPSCIIPTMRMPNCLFDVYRLQLLCVNHCEAIEWHQLEGENSGGSACNQTQQTHTIVTYTFIPMEPRQPVILCRICCRIWCRFWCRTCCTTYVILAVFMNWRQLLQQAKNHQVSMAYSPYQRIGV